MISDLSANSSQPLSARSNEELACAAQAGSLPSFAELVRRLQPRLYNFLLRRTGSPTETEDLTQETFLRAWERIDRYDDRWRFSTWLFTIGTRLAIGQYRDRRRMVTTHNLSHLPETADSPADDADRAEQCRGLWETVSRILNSHQQTALWLRYAESMSIRDIAKILGKSPVSVRVMLFRARESLARHLPHHQQSGKTTTLEPVSTRTPMTSHTATGGVK